MTEDFVVVPETVPLPSQEAAPPEPELGDVIFALDQAAATLKAIVRNRSRSMLTEAREFVRDQPLTIVALALGVAYLYGRLKG